jgi:Transposase DDE domain.
VQGLPPIRSRRRPRRRRPAKLHGDKGYDYNHLRRWLRERGIRHRIARKGIESSTRLARHRRTIERTMSWLGGCRRLHRRYESKAEHFLAFTAIACSCSASAFSSGDHHTVLPPMTRAVGLDAPADRSARRSSAPLPGHVVHGFDPAVR